MGSPQEAEKKRQKIHYIFFWTAGTTFLMVWNSILSMTYYFQARIDPNLDKYYAFGYITGGFLAFFCVDKLGELISFKTLLMSVPCFLIGLFITVCMIAELVNDGQPSKFKLVVFLGFELVMGFLNGLPSTAIVRYYFRFTYIEVSLTNSGTAVAGVLCNLVGLLLAYVIDKDEHTKSGMIYLGFCILSLVLGLIIFGKYFDSGEALEDALVSSPPQNQANKVPFMETFKLMNSFFFQMLLIYTICLSIFPAFNFAMGMGSDHPATYQYALLAYNLLDCIGKSLYAKLPMKDNAWPHIIGLVRIAFVGFVLYLFAGEERSSLMNKPSITLGFMGALALTNGYITSAIFSLSSERVSAKHSSNSGFLMTVGLLLGLTYGSVTMILGKKPTQT